MSTPPAEVISWGAQRVRTGHWRGNGQIAFLAPVPAAPLPSAEFVDRCLRTLASRGYTRVITSALSPVEQTGFLAAGFAVEERLCLLGIDLAAGVAQPPDGLRLARVGRRRHEGVLAVDGAAFTPFWRFDAGSLRDAIDATPSSRFRAAVGGPLGDARRADAEVAGYAICGRAGSRGFVQRLAVDPALRRAGIGSRLLLDGLAWMRRHGVRRAMVNTQADNVDALALYRKVGFIDEPTGLSVLATGLPGEGTA